MNTYLEKRHKEFNQLSIINNQFNKGLFNRGI